MRTMRAARRMMKVEPLNQSITAMTESEFNSLADAVLDRISQAIESSAVDSDCAMKGDGVLEVEFADASRIIVNRHAAAQEIWVAAKSGGHHFRWNGTAWLDTRSGDELFAALSKLVSAQSGQAVVLR